MLRTQERVHISIPCSMHVTFFQMDFLTYVRTNVKKLASN